MVSCSGNLLAYIASMGDGIPEVLCEDDEMHGFDDNSDDSDNDDNI